MMDSLAYIGFTSPRAAEWREFGPQVLGLQVSPPEAEGDDVVRLRMDDAAYRVSVQEGPVDALDHLGWSVGGPLEFEAAIAKLEAAGISVVRESDELAAKRCVAALASFSDPFGWRQELHWGLAMREGTFQPGRLVSGFVTGEQGAGHVVLGVPNLKAAEAFYVGILGFRLSDEVRHGSAVVRFYHCNSRHHSLAMLEVPGVAGVAHLMLEAASLDDVGTAEDIARERDVLAVSLGRHTNDHMVSIYVETPSGFQVEFGWGAIQVQPSSKANMIDRGDIWGHHPVGGRGLGLGLVRSVGAGAEAVQA
ncbi:VOC family protein [Streptomyces bobili]|uniref:VOC family protein n=1 Tax=Streptomyces bobili TaxID=67280 RepID=UPI0036565C78